MHSSVLLANLLVAGAFAAPASKLQARGDGQTFALITTVTNAPPSVGELNQGIWAVGASSNGDAILVERSQGALFYEYESGGSTSVATGCTGISIHPGGTATVPSANTVQLDENSATVGVSIGGNAQGIPVLQYEGGSFMACRAKTLNSSSPNPNDIVLSFVQAGQRDYADCANVTLISNCIGGGSGSGSVGALGTPITVDCQPM